METLNDQIETEIALDFSVDTSLAVLGLLGPIGDAIAVIIKCFQLKSIYKQKRISYFLEEFISLAKPSELTLEQFAEEIYKTGLEPLFLDFLEKSTLKISLTNTKEKIKLFSKLLAIGYKAGFENEKLFNELDICLELLDKINTNHFLLLSIYYQHKDKEDFFKDEVISLLNSQNYDINNYYTETGYLMSLGLLESNSYKYMSYLKGNSNTLDSLICSQLGLMFIEKLKNNSINID